MTRGDATLPKSKYFKTRNLNVFKYWDHISNDINDKELLNITKKIN